MDLAGLTLTTRRLERLDDVLARLVGDDPIAPTVGLLAHPDAESPPGLQALERVRRVPDGTVDAAREFVLGFDVLRHVGIGVLADAPLAEVGVTVVQRMPRSGPAVLAPCRIVEVVDTVDEVGFTYAALPGHPFAGEETFHVRRDDAGVTCRVASLSRPVAGAARLARPLTSRIQGMVAGRYADGMATAAGG